MFKSTILSHHRATVSVSLLFRLFHGSERFTPYESQLPSGFAGEKPVVELSDTSARTAVWVVLFIYGKGADEVVFFDAESIVPHIALGLCGIRVELRQVDTAHRSHPVDTEGDESAVTAASG